MNRRAAAVTSPPPRRSVSPTNTPPCGGARFQMPDVLLLTRYERLGASSRVRFLQFLPALEAQGFTFDVQPLLDNVYVRSLYGGPPVGARRLAMSYVRRLRA